MKAKGLLSFSRKLNRITLQLLLILVIVVTTWQLFKRKLSLYWRDFGYLVRPLWDTPPQGFDVIPIYPSVQDMSNEQWCALHGWTANTNISANINLERELKTTKVIDTIIFSIELDLLEIRIHELWDQVDMFIIAESDYTFTGQPKAMAFDENRERFKFAESKIHYVRHHGHELGPGETAFEREFEMRQSITEALRQVAVARDIIVMSDVDEIPRGEAIRLLKTCDGWGDAIHLQQRNFIYSFEFLYDLGNWKTSVQRYNPRYTFFDRGRLSDNLLADAGWHCSFCFPKIADFQFKMTAFSHSDRITDKHMLDREAIHERVCNGENIFEMLPEVHTFKELIEKWGPYERVTSFLNLPNYLISQNDRMKYLLPGGCDYLK